MKKIFLLTALLLSLFATAQNVGIGTTTPNAYGKLHVHNDATFDASISLTNGLTTDATLRGARFRMLNNDLNIINYEATGKLNLATGVNIRMTLDDAGNVGIGTITPTYRLHVLNNTASAISAIQTTVAGERAELQFLGDNNPFNTLFIQKYSPGASGTFGGISKDNLSVISTGGNAGTLLLGTGDGVSPLVFVTGTGERMRVEANGQVAIGTNTPASTGKLHIHDDISNQDVSLVMTNSLTGPNNLRGLRLRLLNSDVALSNNEITGKIRFTTAFQDRMTINSAGNVGIGTTSPNHLLEIINNSNTDGLNILHNGNNAYGAFINMGNAPGNIGMFINNSFNYTPGGSKSIGLWAVSGSGTPINYLPTINYAVVGECRNPALGGGVLGISNAPSTGLFTGGVLGNNFSTDPEAYGVVGLTSSSNGAGVAGKTTNGSSGVYGLSLNATGPALKAEAMGTSSTAIEIKNGAIKVTGVSKPVFQITAQTGVNIAGNILNIPISTQANSATDLLIVTPVFGIAGVYLNKPIGVWWNGANWTIFTQDLSAMPNGAEFNVLVVKQ
ncbi:MAG: hypothetical protein NTW29_08025 [Bacteroidetes bacterium]|nr:hypothetical protein [Bacteroidota bacterium]